MQKGVLGFALAVSLTLPTVATAELSTEVQQKLAESKYVYIASMRKSGEFGRPAEIWFLWHDGAVYVGTPPDTWRARRIRAGRPQAKIWVGTRKGPSFRATGSIVNEPDTLPILFETYARKYSERWANYEDRFRKGFETGKRVLIRYVPDE